MDNTNQVGKELKDTTDAEGEVDISDEMLLAAEGGASGRRQPPAVVIGASLVRPLDMAGEAAVVAKSGTEAAQVQVLLDQAAKVVEADTTEKVIMHLGTNDLLHNKNDSEIVKLNLSEALGKVKDAFPHADIGVSSIPPRKGKSPGIFQYNEKAKAVNHYVEMLTDREERVSYIDTYAVFAPRGGHVKKSLYSDTDGAGIHFSQAGVEALKQELSKFLKPNDEDSRKRERSAGTTPNSEEKDSKRGKQ